MSNDTRDSSLTSFILGLGIGAVIGILFAPASGRDIRENLLDAAADRAERLRNVGKSIVRDAQSTLGMAKDQVRDAVKAGKRAYHDADRRATQSEPYSSAEGY